MSTLHRNWIDYTKQITQNANQVLSNQINSKCRTHSKNQTTFTDNTVCIIIVIELSKLMEFRMNNLQWPIHRGTKLLRNHARADNKNLWHVSQYNFGQKVTLKNYYSGRHWGYVSCYQKYCNFDNFAHSCEQAVFFLWCSTVSLHSISITIVNKDLYIIYYY